MLFKSRITAVLSAASFVLLQACIATPPSSYDPNRPTVSAESVKVTYTSAIRKGDPLPIPTQRHLESVQIVPASDETKVTHYNLYFGEENRTKIGLDSAAPLITSIPATGDGQVIDYKFPTPLITPVLAQYLLVCTANNGLEYCAQSNNMDLFADDFAATALAAEDLKAAVSANNEASCPGLDAMATCGDLICNGVETAANCRSDCGTYTLASFNFQVYCDEVQSVFHPESIAELQAIIADADTQGKRVKVTGAAANSDLGGSSSGLICTDGYLIITDRIDENNANFPLQLETFEGIEVVNAPAGMRMHDLGEWLYSNGKQMGFIHLGWRDATLAGAIGTSAHGSSPKHTNILSHKVVAMDVITPTGELKSHSRGTTGVTDPDLWSAMLTHMGYLGVVVGVRIEVEPAQNLHVRVTYHDQDELFNDPSKSVYQDIKDCDFGQYNWFPTLGKYARWCGEITNAAAEDGANNVLLAPYGGDAESEFQPQPHEIFQAFHVATCFPEQDILKTAGSLRADGLHMTPPLLKQFSGELRYTSDAIGPIHRVTSAHLLDTGREVFQMDFELAVPFQNMEPALQLVNDFAHGMNAKNREMPLPLVGVFVRFSMSDDKSLMAYTGVGGDFEKDTPAVHIELPIPAPINFDDARYQEYMAEYEALAKTLVNDYGARAHWGKNQYYQNGETHADIFELQRDTNAYGTRLTRFNSVVGSVDPNGMFANRQAKVIGIQYPQFTYPANW